jgi:cysteine sulfinate desulfinase/cysteine desulfurase-like protein
MGVPEVLAKSAVIISAGWASTQEDIDAFLKVWSRITASSDQNNKQSIA